MARAGGGWLVVVALLLLAGGRGAASSRPADEFARLQIGWAWPLPRLASLGAAGTPEISSGWGSPRDQGTSTAHEHQGVDVMYPRLARAGTNYPLPDHGSRDYQLPEGTQALAARGGTVADVATTTKGTHVIVDHGNGVHSFYQHLVAAYVSEGDRVVLGEPLGECGWDPSGHDQIRHLHFGLTVNGNWIDPQPAMQAWAVVSG